MTDLAQSASTSSRRAGWIAAALLLVWYVATMARGLMFFDTAELALVGAQLGLGHPPGAPLYTLLLGLFARLPGLDPLLGMNLLSALCAALCALPADALLRRVGVERPGVRLVTLLAVGAVAPNWDQATRIELYALATLLSLWLLAWGAHLADAARSDLRGWLAAGALAGALAAVNPIFALAAAGAVGLYALPALLRAGALPFTRAVGAAAVGGVALTGIYPLYLLWVRGRTDRLVWGELDTLDGALAYLSGADYAQNVGYVWAKMPLHFAEWAGWLLGQGALPALALGLAGWLAVPAARRRLVLLAGPAFAGVAFTLGYDTFYPEIPDYNGYLVPAMWLCAVGLGALLARLPRAALPVGGAALALTLFTGARPAWERSRAGVDMARTLAERTLDSMPEHALLLVESDHLVFPLMYLQEVEGRRPDVVVFNLGFGASGWYWRHLYRRHPGLPKIALAAPSTAVRVRRLVDADPARPVHAERIDAAVGLRLKPCAATWTLALGPACANARDDGDAFATQLAAWWAGPAADDLIAPRVLARLGQTRAEALWALGDASAALRALAAGTPTPDLPAPDGLRRPRAAPPLRAGLDAPLLIGDPSMNRALGAGALELLGQPEAAKRWATSGP